MIVRFYRWLMKEPEPCQSCEVLRELLASTLHEKNKLLQLIVPAKEAEVEPEELKEVKPRFVPWAVRKQMLEKEDREAAKLKRNFESTSADIEELEKELDIVSKQE